MNLKESAMIAVLKTGQWRAVRHDQEVSEEVANNHGSEKEMGRFNKILADAPEIKEVSQAITAARTYHYQHTLPWLDMGQRVLTSAMFPEYTAKMQEFEAKIEMGARDVERNYDRIKAEARRKLNGLYKEEDYPKSWQIRAKYRLYVTFYPMPDANHFRYNLAADELKEVQAETAAAIKEGLAEAMKELYNRLYETIRGMKDVLSRNSPKIHETLVPNLAKLCGIIPKLNITGDPALIALKDETERELLKYTASDLREDENTRKEAAQKADDILKKIAEVMG